MVTMADVARASGVSSSTVSHVLNGTRHVSEAVRLRVEAAVTQLGYRRNAAARTLAGGSSHTIGLAISGLTNPYFGPLLHAIERHASREGFVLVLGDTHDERAMERRVIESLLDRRVDGLIVAPSSGFSETISALDVGSAPLVIIDRGTPLPYDQLTPENTESVRALTSHLISHGHTRIAAVTGLPGLESTSQRVDGYTAALAEHGIPLDPSLMVAGDSNADTSFASVSELLERSNRPTALITLNNAMTIGALRACQRAEISIPRDLALASYDDFEWSDLFEPGLTAVSQDVARMGVEAVDLLLSRIRGNQDPPVRRVIDTTLHLRTSCGGGHLPADSSTLIQPDPLKGP